MNEKYDMSAIFWAVDFCRAMNGRNRFLKLLFRLAVGKYAYREYQGMRRALADSERYPDWEYELENADYHSD